MNPPQGQALGYGSFQLGGMSLTLPIENLREVVPMRELIALPCPLRAVVGGVALRGVSVPVLDLRMLLDPAQPRQAGHCIIVVAEDGCLLGLLADRVQSLFFVGSECLNAMREGGGTHPILKASVLAGPKGPLTNLLDVQALANTPHLPMVKDPLWEQLLAQNKLGETHHDFDPANEQGQRCPLMLMRSGKLDFAIDTTGIETTLANPQLQPQTLQADYFAGTVEYRNGPIPAIELCALLGLPGAKPPTKFQAFVIRTAQGPVAYLIESILEIVQVSAHQQCPLPPLGLPRPGLISGVLPNAMLPPELVTKIKPWADQQWVLNPMALAQLPEVVDLVATYTQTAHNTQHAADEKAPTRDPATLQRLITFALDRPSGCCIDEVTEVLPYRESIRSFDRSDGLLGLLSNRGQTLPVYDLLRVVRGEPAMLTSTASVLVVHSAGGPVGFAVPKLLGIESARLLPPVPLLTSTERPAYNPQQTTQTTAELKASGLPLVALLPLPELAGLMNQRNCECQNA